MAPPSLIDFVLSKNLADGVASPAAPRAPAIHRLGVAWTEQRFAGERDPYLRARVPRDRLRRSGRRRLRPIAIRTRTRRRLPSKLPPCRRSRARRCRQSIVAGAPSTSPARMPEGACHDRYLRLTGQFVVIVPVVFRRCRVRELADLSADPAGLRRSSAHLRPRRGPQGRMPHAFPRGNRKTCPQHAAQLQDCPRGRRPIYVELDLAGTNDLSGPFAADRYSGRWTFARLSAFRGAGGTIRSRRADARHAAHAKVSTINARRRSRSCRDQMFVVDFRSESGEFVFR